MSTKDLRPFCADFRGQLSKMGQGKRNTEAMAMVPFLFVMRKGDGPARPVAEVVAYRVAIVCRESTRLSFPVSFMRILRSDASGAENVRITKVHPARSGFINSLHAYEST